MIAFLKRTFLVTLVCLPGLFGRIQTLNAQISVNDSLRYLLSYFRDNTFNDNVLEKLKLANDNVKRKLKPAQLNKNDTARSKDWKDDKNGAKTRTMLEKNGNWDTETKFANGSYSSMQGWPNRIVVTTYFSFNGDYCITASSDSLYAYLQRINRQIIYYCYYTANKGHSEYSTSIYIFEDTPGYEYNKTKTIGSQSWYYHEARDINGIVFRRTSFSDQKTGTCWKDSEQNAHLMYRADEYIRNSGEIFNAY